MTRFALALVALGAFAARGPAQPPPERARPAGRVILESGFEVFRGLLDKAGIRPVPARELRAGTVPSETIVVIFGNPYLPLTTSRFLQVTPYTLAERALSSDGAVLFAHDGQSTVRFVGTPSIHVGGFRVAVDRPELAYRGWIRDPFLVPEPPGRSRDRVTQLFAGLDRVATQHPSYLHAEFDESGLRRVLARFPRGECHFHEMPNNRFDADRNPFALAGCAFETEHGREHRLLAFADPAVFVNSLLVDPEADNLILADRVVKYLQGPGQARKRCVFIHEGQVIEDFSEAREFLAAQDPDLKLPNPLAMLFALQDKIVDFGNEAIDRVQQKDVLTQGVLGSNENPEGQAQRARMIATGALVAAAVWAAWFLLRKVWKSRQPADAPPPPYAGGSVTADRSGGLFDRRKRELVRRNNLYEPVRDALRELFTQAGAPPGGKLPPRVACSPTVRKPGKLREAVFELWKLAYGKPAVVTARRWKELEPVIDRLHRELADGTWWFIEVATPSEA